MERAELLSFPLFSPLEGKNTKITAEQPAHESQKIWFIEIFIFGEGAWPSVLSLHDPVCE